MQINFDRGRWSPATRRLYEQHWRDWVSFCGDIDACPFPPKPTDLADFIRARAKTLAMASVDSRLNAIVSVCAAHRKEIKIKGTIVADTRAELHRQYGTAHKPKQALTNEDIKRIADGIPANNLRDRALLLIGFASAMRRSELAALDVGDLAFADDALVITVRRSKTDKAGKGELVAVERVPGLSCCPVAALERYLDGTKSGPVFRTNRGTRIAPRDVATMVKLWGSNAGFSEAELGAHSLRRGCITSMFNGGGKIEEIGRHARQKTVTVTLGYVQAHAAQLNPALKHLWGSE